MCFRQNSLGKNWEELSCLIPRTPLKVVTHGAQGWSSLTALDSMWLKNQVFVGITKPKTMGWWWCVCGAGAVIYKFFHMFLSSLPKFVAAMAPAWSEPLTPGAVFNQQQAHWDVLERAGLQPPPCQYGLAELGYAAWNLFFSFITQKRGLD